MILGGQELWADDLNCPVSVESNVDAGVNTTSDVYVTLTGGPGVVFVAPQSGYVWVHIKTGMVSDTDGIYARASFQIRTGNVIGAGTIIANTNSLDSVLINKPITIDCGGTSLISGLTPGSTYNAQMMYRRSGGAGTAFFARRTIGVQPDGAGAQPATFAIGQTLTAADLNAIATQSNQFHITAADATNSISYTTLPSAGPDGLFTAPRSGNVWVNFSTSLVGDLSGTWSLMSFEVRTGNIVGSGTLVLGASDSRCLGLTGNSDARVGRTSLIPGLTPGSIYNIRAMYRAEGGGYGWFANRRLCITRG